jgi:hypothetical protein
MCYKLAVNYVLQNQSNNNTIKLNLKKDPRVVKDDVYNAALEYSKNYKNDKFIIRIYVKNEPCWISEAECYKNYLASLPLYHEALEYEVDYEERWEIQNGEFVDDF